MLSIAASSGLDSTQSIASLDAHSVDDAACALLVVMVQSQLATQSGAKTDVELDAKKLQELKQQLADALQQAKEASEHSGFWGFIGKVLGSDVAKIAGAVAAVAAVAATGGAAAPLLLLSVSLALETGATVGAKLGLDPKLCAGLSLAGAAVGLFSGAGTAQSASAFSQAMQVTAMAGNATSAAATGAGAACTYEGEIYHADELGFQANATRYRGDQVLANLSMDDAIALLESSLRTESRETDSATEIAQQNVDSNAFIFDRI